jgi:FkbM family methyltransferase
MSSQDESSSSKDNARSKAVKIRLHNFFRGLRSNLKFTNKFQIIYDRIFRRNLSLTHYIWKNRFVFICNSKSGDHQAFQECFCERAYDFLLDKCHFPANRISYVNLGANVGAFDLLLLDRGLIVDAGLAVELNPLTYTRCLLNFQTNKLFSARAINAGIAGNNGSVHFTPRRLSITDSIYAEQESGIEQVQVELLTLETLLMKHGNHFQQFDLLKIDCEQAEYAIIRSTPLSLFQKFRYIIIEFHPEPEGEAVGAAYAKLQAAGFQSLKLQSGKYITNNSTDIFIRA